MSQGTYHYSVYGLTVASCLPLPELSAGTGTPDVTVRYGSVPEALDGAEVVGGFYQASPGLFLLHVEDVARYLISEGNLVVIQRAQGAGDEEVGLFLLGCAFAPILQQRGLLPLHCSAVEIDGSCIAFAGHSGSGKSTLAGAFLKNGYRILTDDIGVVTIGSEGIPILYPGYPQLKLWADTLTKLGEDEKSLTRIALGIEKFRRPMRDAFCGHALPLNRLYLLSVSPVPAITLTPLTGAAKVAALITHTYHAGFLQGLGKRPDHFKQCNAVALGLPVIQVVRPKEPFLLRELVDCVREDLSR